MLLRYLYKFVIDELGVQPKQFQIHPSSICEITATKKRWKSGHYFEVIVPIYTYVNFYTSHRRIETHKNISFVADSLKF